MTTTWNETQARIIREASELTPVKVLITILAFPFFVLGAVIGLIWVVAILIWQAIWVGVSQTRSSLTKRA